MTGLLWFGAGFLAGSILFDQLWRAHRRIAKRIAALTNHSDLTEGKK